MIRCFCGLACLTSKDWEAHSKRTGCLGGTEETMYNEDYS